MTYITKQNKTKQKTNKQTNKQKQKLNYSQKQRRGNLGHMLMSFSFFLHISFNGLIKLAVYSPTNQNQLLEMMKIEILFLTKIKLG